MTGAGEVVQASADQNADVLWALRGGKPGLGIVTEVRVRLVELPALYAGSLFFEEPHIEAALRSWIAWTAAAPPQVTTSAVIVRFPPADVIPPPLRGRRLLSLRFAHPGDATEGARLAAPLRALAPVYLDMLDAMPIADVAKIFNDPPGPVPSWASGGMLTNVDQDFASVLLRHVGAGTDGPFLAAEVRHLGEAAARDVPGGSAVGGRGALFTFALIGTNPAFFATTLPDAEARLVDDLGPWLSPEANGNFAAHPGVRRTVTAAAPAHVRASWLTCAAVTTRTGSSAELAAPPWRCARRHSAHRVITPIGAPTRHMRRSAGGPGARFGGQGRGSRCGCGCGAGG